MTTSTAEPLTPPSPDDIQVVDGVVDRITYRNEESGYTIARLKVPKQKPLITVAGHLPGISVGEGVRLEGHWTKHPQYGRQFTVSRYQSVAPGTVASIKRYLGSGLLRGVGPVMAEHIVNTFGTQTLEILDNEPERLAEVPGMGKRKADAIAEVWRERRALRDLMSFLQEQGLPVALAVRILKKFGTASESIVREQPYRLSAEVYGVEFQLADAIAARSGIGPEAPQRVGAGLAHSLRQAADSGHVYLPVPELVAAASKLLGLRAPAVEQALPDLVQSGFVWSERLPDGTEIAYLPELYNAELSVATSLRGLVRAGRSRLALFSRADWASAWRYLDARESVQLSEQQRTAIQAALTSQVAVITGGPGTGKTTALRGIVRLVNAKNGSVVLAAPTGRAAKRLSEATGVEASTIHRLLELRPGGGYDVRAPLEADLVIIDEASMMDLLLADALLRAVPRGAHLLLVGDADQLPPVGPGSVFSDVIESGAVPITRLETIFRQPEGSAIVSNAHLINAGETPVTGRQVKDFYFIGEPRPTECAQLVVDLVSRRLPSYYHLDPVDDIQVLAPVYAGACGIEALNAGLQAALNPPDPSKDERRYGNRIFRVGDKVMQVVNDYDRQVANGELGRVIRIDLEEQTVSVSFDLEGAVSYGFQELDELTHAYAISVHKAQGSEYPAIVLPLLPQHGRLLQRNLLYTAVSRARKLAVLAGSPEAMQRAIANNKSSRRYSGLVERLRLLGSTA